MTGRGAGDDGRVQIMVRLPKALVRQVDHLAVDLNLYRGECMALLLTEALQAREAK